MTWLFWRVIRAFPGLKRWFPASRIFHADYYLAQNPDVLKSGLDPAWHYFRYGAEEGRSPHPLFDPAHYAQAAGIQGLPRRLWLRHFIREGEARGLSPHALVDLRKLAVGYGVHAPFRGLLMQFANDAAPPCDPHPLFDVAFYLKRYPDVANQKINPLVHYAWHGAAEGRNPHPLFDVAFYLKRYPDVANQKINPLVHFVMQFANDAAPPCDPHPLFDVAFYLKRYPDVANQKINPLVHFVMQFANDAAPPCDPHPLFDVAFYLKRYPDVANQKINPLVHFVMQFANDAAPPCDPHPLFDVAFYLKRYPDVANQKINPLVHYAWHGAAEGRNPHPLFDVAFYLKRYPDVANQKINPLVHFVMQFANDAAPPCDPHPLFDVAFYLKRYPDVANQKINPLVHFVMQFANDAAPPCDPHPLFDVAFYLKRYPDVANQKINPLVHFVMQFANDAAPPCDPHPLFDVAFYLKRYPDVANQKINPLVHYAWHGAAEGRNPSPFFDANYYVAQLPRPVPRGMTPLQHYTEVGGPLGFSPSLRFDPHTFAKRYRDAQYRGIDLLAACLELYGGIVPAEFAFPSPTQRDAASGYKASYRGEAEPGDKRRVLLVAHSADNVHFGAERSFLDMVRGANASGYAVFAVLPRVAPTYIRALVPHCAEIAVLTYDWWRSARLPDPDAVSLFRRYIAERRIELVHSNTIMLREPLIAARAEGRPALLHAREIIEHDPDLLAMIGEPAATIAGKVGALADMVVTNSRAAARSYPQGRVRLLRNCVDITCFTPDSRPADGTVRFGLLSSNIPKKGLGDFVALAKACIHRAPIARFVAIGPVTEYACALQEELAKEGLIGTVEFPGYIDDSAAAIASIDVIVNFSHFAESFGRTVLEGMAARRPALVYDHGALPELVKEEVNGFVVPFQDWEAAIPIVERLCADAALRVRLGEAGARMAAQFAFESYTAALEEIYREALAPTPQRLPARRADSHLPPPERVLPARHLPACIKSADLKLAYFLWHFPVPSETFVLNELRYLAHAGIDVRVFCRQSPHPDFKPDFPIEWERVSSPEQLAARLAETKRNVVHAHFVYPTVTNMVWPACTIAGVPFTFFPHAQDIFRHDNDQRNRIGEVANAAACLRVLAPGRFHRQHLVERGVPDEKILVLPQGIDVSKYPLWHGPRRRGRKVVGVHRFTEKKGLDHLIRAAALLIADGVSVELYGYGEDEDALKALAVASGAANVAFMGPVSDHDALLRVLANADLFAAPCVRAASGDMDGIPTVLMEAMASGVPVLATAVSSIPDLVINNITGFVASDTEPKPLAIRIRDALSAPQEKIDAIIHAAREHVERYFDTRRLVPALVRLWSGRTIDIAIVSWNNLAELREVISRVFQFTRMPFHLVVCDNASEPDVRDFLHELHRKRDNVTIIDRGLNTYVGPGTNCAIDHGNSDYIVYLCGKEGFILQHGWERAVVDYMDAHPDVGLAGTLGYSPTYLRGADYPNSIQIFDKFRNREFAAANPERVFRHVQGGLFAVRRTMYDEIGGFSEVVPHGHTDVEYSYYVESCGWQLGEIPGLLALYNKTRPPLASRFTEQVLAVHPPTLRELPQFDQAVAGRLALCNVCFAFLNDGFDEGERCPHCSSTPAARTLMRGLAESTLTYRRLKALVLEPPPGIQRFLAEQFQGRQLGFVELLQEIQRSGSINHPSASVDVAYLGYYNGDSESLSGLTNELARVLASGSTVFADNSVVNALQDQRFRRLRELRYASRVVGYDPNPLHVFARIQ